MSHIRNKIRLSMAAIVILFLLGGMVLGSSLMWFETKMKMQAIPRSMVEYPIEHTPFDSAIWYEMLLICASVGLPLGMYVVSTLHDCEKLEEPLDRIS